MKWFSLGYLWHSAGRALLRFPLVLLSALIGVSVGIYLVEAVDSIQNFLPWINIMLCAGLGIPLYFCVDTSCELRGFSTWWRWTLHGLATVVLVLIYLSLPDLDSTHNTQQPYIRYVIYSVVVHLLVSFLPFGSSRGLDGFWQFNKLLFVRFWTALLYSTVLFLGLALALGAMHLLFDIDIRGELYGDLYILVAGLVNTWVFVSGLPDNLRQLEEEVNYPRGLRLFAQYVLLPLLIIYLVILYVYGGKILLAWNWPHGMVSILIVSVAALGILSFLLLYPYARLTGFAWIAPASRWFYVALLPLLIILFLAIGMRLSAYGLTVGRYLVLFIGLWLLMVCVYTLSGRNTIRFIPASFALLLMAISFGPWGLFSASERAQVARLKVLLEQGGMLKNDSLVYEAPVDSLIHQGGQEHLLKNNNKLSPDQHNEVVSIVGYLDNYHGFRAIRPWFRQDVDGKLRAFNKGKGRYGGAEESTVYLQAMGLDPASRNTDIAEQFLEYSSSEVELIDIRGYDLLLNLQMNGDEPEDTLAFAMGSDSLQLFVHPDGQRLVVRNAGAETGFRLDSLMQGLVQRYGESSRGELPTAELSLAGHLPGYALQLRLKRLNLVQTKARFRAIYLEGYLLMRHEAQPTK